MTPPPMVWRAEAEPHRIANRAPHRSHAGPRPDMLSASHYAAQRRRQSRARIALVVLLTGVYFAAYGLAVDRLPMWARVAAVVAFVAFWTVRHLIRSRQRAAESRA